MGNGQSARRVLGPLQKWGSIILGALFLVAGTSKALDPWSFHAALPGYGITGAFRSVVVVLAPALEVGLGLALVARWRVRQTSLVAGVFLVLFIVAISIGWSRGTLDECGCFGAMLERSPPEAIAIDAMFLALAVVVWRRSTEVTGRILGRREMAILSGAGVSTLVLTFSLLQVGPSGLQAAEGLDLNPEMDSVDLSRGEHLLYLFHHECPQCAKMSLVVADYSRDPVLPPVVGFTLLTPRDQIDTYRDLKGLRIPVQDLPRKRFARITGEASVPQLVFVRDGEIVRIWSIVLPDARELRELLAGF